MFWLVSSLVSSLVLASLWWATGAPQRIREQWIDHQRKQRLYAKRFSLNSEARGGPAVLLAAVDGYPALAEILATAGGPDNGWLLGADRQLVEDTLQSLDAYLAKDIPSATATTTPTTAVSAHPRSPSHWEQQRLARKSRATILRLLYWLEEERRRNRQYEVLDSPLLLKSSLEFPSECDDFLDEEGTTLGTSDSNSSTTSTTTSTPCREPHLFLRTPPQTPSQTPPETLGAKRGASSDRELTPRPSLIRRKRALSSAAQEQTPARDEQLYDVIS